MTYGDRSQLVCVRGSFYVLALGRNLYKSDLTCLCSAGRDTKDRIRSFITDQEVENQSSIANSASYFANESSNLLNYRKDQASC